MTKPGEPDEKIPDYFSALKHAYHSGGLTCHVLRLESSPTAELTISIGEDAEHNTPKGRGELMVAVIGLAEYIMWDAKDKGIDVINQSYRQNRGGFDITLRIAARDADKAANLLTLQPPGPGPAR